MFPAVYVISFSIPDYEVGFQVSLVRSYDIPEDGKMIYDHVIINIGGAFDQTSGKFTAPVSGTYMFSANIVCDQTSTIHASIFKNRSAVVNLLCDNSTGNTWNQGGGSAILKLSAGDFVWVGKIWPNRAAKAYGNGMTSFSGYLLHAT